MIFGYFLSFHQRTPIHLAAESGCIKVVKYLVNQGADINIQDENGVIIYVTIHTIASNIPD